MKKFVYITIALALVAPFMSAFVFLLEWPIYQFVSMKLWGQSMIWFDNDGKIALTITLVLQIVCYSFIALFLRSLYKKYRSGGISSRAFIYPVMLAGISVTLALIFGISTLAIGA